MLLAAVLAGDAIWDWCKEVMKQVGSGPLEKIGDDLLSRVRQGTLPPNHNLEHALCHSLAGAARVLAWNIHDPNLVSLSKLIKERKAASLADRVAEMFRGNITPKTPADYWLVTLIEQTKNPDSFKDFPLELVLTGNQLSSLLLEEIDHCLRDHIQREFLAWIDRHLGNVPNKPENFDNYVLTGWILPGGSGHKLTFYEAFCLFFREELKKDENVFHAFTAITLGDLKEDLEEVLHDFESFKGFLNSQNENFFSFLRTEFDKVHGRFDRVDEKLDKLLTDNRATFRFISATPPAERDLKGRVLEQDRIAAALRAGRHVVIHGMPGLGKTQLALLVANALKQDFPAGQIFVSLQIRAASVRRSCDVLIAALRAIRGATAELPADQASLRAAYDNALSDGKWLVVVDNAQTPDDAEVLKPHPPSALLVTARPKLVLDGADCMRPDLLSPDDANPNISLKKSQRKDCAQCLLG